MSQKTLVIVHEVWAAACGHHGISEELGGMVSWCGWKGLHWYDPPDR